MLKVVAVEGYLMRKYEIPLSSLLLNSTVKYVYHLKVGLVTANTLNTFDGL